MEDYLRGCEITVEDLRAALADLKGFVDVTEEDLLKIYSSALVHAKDRMKHAITVGDLMTRDVVTVKQETTIEEAARRLTGLRISGMPVIDDSDRVLGVVGELDLISLGDGAKGNVVRNLFRRLMGEPVPAGRTGDTVGEVMSKPAITVRPGAGLREAARMLESHRIKRLPVVNDEGRLIGVISRADIVRGMSRAMSASRIRK